MNPLGISYRLIHLKSVKSYLESRLNKVICEINELEKEAEFIRK